MLERSPSTILRRVFPAAGVLLISAVSSLAQTTLFQDNFAVQGPKLNMNAWTTVTGPPSYLGRTQLADWITPGAAGQFVVGADGAQLVLQTFNPTGFSLYGTHGKTLMSFVPAANITVSLTARLRLTSLQPGLVYGIYFYGPVSGPLNLHDEIDIELLTNLLQPGAPMQVHFNRYANEPLGVGHPAIVNLPAGFDPLQAHDWTIRWSLNRIEYLVDGVSLYSATDHVPQGAMQANVIAWAPQSDWQAAYSSSLQPVASAAQNQSFLALLQSVSVIATGGAGSRFVPVTPCRIIDTRNPNGTFGGPSVDPPAIRNIPVPQSACSIPANARAYSLNFTVVPWGSLGYISVWPEGQTQPLVSTLNSLDGRVVANAAIVPAGANGGISLFASNRTDVVIDINGYFVDAATPDSLSFYSLSPCRVADTRGNGFTGAFGAPFLSGGGSGRSFPVRASGCGVPSSARVYSLNITAVPRGTLGYLTAWPTGQPQPFVSTLNSTDGSVVANAAIVPADTNGAVSIFVTNDADVVIDINGYFGTAGFAGAQSLYTVTPCRIVDTRGNGLTGQFGPPALALFETRNFPVSNGPCAGIPMTAQAYSLNVTVVPPGTLGHLSAWPAGQIQPVVSTLNSYLGRILANAAIVPAGQSGAVSVFVTNPTEVILDINGYFAP